MQQFATSLVGQIALIRDELKTVVEAKTLESVRENLDRLEEQTSIMLNFVCQAAGINLDEIL